VLGYNSRKWIFMKAGTASKKRKRAVRMDPRTRHRQLLSVAMRLCSQEGIGDTNHARVGVAAGVSTPTVFLYFPTRLDLLNAVLDEVELYLLNLVDRSSVEEKTASKKLLSIVGAYSNAIDNDSAYARIFLNWGASGEDKIWQKFLSFQDRLLEKFERIVDDGKKSGEVSRTVNPVWAAHLICGGGTIIAQMKFRGLAASEIEDFFSALVHASLQSG
jgi:TetR/AcrR family transcriptional regulator, hemagglutinin/protease regulatory protein